MNIDLFPLDFMLPPKYQVVRAKQYDSMNRALHIQLLEGGEKFSMPTGMTAELRIKRPDGSRLSKASTLNYENDASKILAEFPEHSFDQPGMLRAGIVIKSGDEVRSTSLFWVLVEPALVDHSAEV